VKAVGKAGVVRLAVTIGIIDHPNLPPAGAYRHASIGQYRQPSHFQFNVFGNSYGMEYVIIFFGLRPGHLGLRLYATKKKKEAVLKKFHDVIIKRFTK
jgi:hypothetical protein